ncbi:MAG: hypothetical protein WCG95_09640, partial [bacterium]
MSIKDDVTKLAEQNRVKTVSLHVDSENEPLVKMYKKFGFEVKGTEPSYYENGNSAYYMEATVGKTEKQTPKVIQPQIPTIKNQNDLRKHLEGLKDKNGNARLTSDDMRYIVSSADTPEKAQLAGKLAQLEDKNGNARLDNYDIREIVSSADTPEKAQFKAEYAYNKEFLAKIDTLDSSIGNKLYAETLKSGMTVDVERMSKLYNYLCENKINLQQHGEERITNQSIINLFDASMLKAVDLLDDGVIKYATKLKYDKFKEFITNSSKLVTGLDKETYAKLKGNLSKFSTPGLKFDRLQSIIALKNADSESAMMNEAINLIKSPRTTVAQINLTNEIFTSNKTYQEQIQEFFEKFNVAEDKKIVFRKFFEEQKSILAPKTQNTVENQLMILDKKIQDVRGNGKIPEFKKSAYIAQLEKQKTELNAKPQNTSTTKLSDKALNLLAQQIEHHINIPSNNAEFNSFLNAQIYKRLNIEPTPELLGALNFDKQYLPNLFSALSDSDFSEQFTKLIELIKENPSKPLSEL